MRAVLAAILLGCLSLVSACAVEVGASKERVAAARYASAEGPYVEVVSMVGRRNNRSAHTALIINASERVIYDPAGTFQHEDLIERGDVHYGATDRMVSYYERYHARFSHFVHSQRIPVSAQVAEAVLRRTQAQGPSPKMFCTYHTIDVLNESLPGVTLERTFRPELLRRQIAEIPGVIDRYRYEEDRGQSVPAG